MKNPLALVICLTLLSLVFLAACTSQPATPDPLAIKPSKPGEIGEALGLQGDATRGEVLFVQRCQECHGERGQGGILNPGAEAGVIPALNPVESSLANQDDRVFAANLDLFIEHGSVPRGKPQRIMLAYGDFGILKPQEIADLLAYIIKLNR